MENERDQVTGVFGDLVATCIFFGSGSYLQYMKKTISDFSTLTLANSRKRCKFAAIKDQKQLF